MDDKVLDQPQTPAAPPLPVGGGVYGSKERQPTTYLEGEPQPMVPPELTGVLEPVHEAGIEVPYQAQKAGLAPAKEAVPVATVFTGEVHIPYTAEQAISVIKIHQTITDAARWLAVWCIRQLDKIRYRSQQPIDEKGAA